MTGRAAVLAVTIGAALRCAAALVFAAALSFAAAGAEPKSPAATAVRMVVIANFENGADTGDKPGE